MAKGFDMQKVLKLLYRKNQRILTLGDNDYIFAHGLTQKTLKYEAGAAKNQVLFTTPQPTTNATGVSRTELFKTIEATYLKNIDPISGLGMEMMVGQMFHRIVYVNPKSERITGARYGVETNNAYHNHVKDFLRVAVHNTYGVAEEPKVKGDDELDELEEQEKLGGQIHLITKAKEHLNVYKQWRLGTIVEELNTEFADAIDDKTIRQPFLEELPPLRFVWGNFLDLLVRDENTSKNRQRKVKREKQPGEDHHHDIYRWRVHVA